MAASVSGGKWIGAMSEPLARWRAKEGICGYYGVALDGVNQEETGFQLAHGIPSRMVGASAQKRPGGNTFLMPEN
jgi:hypothetical protein